jgi:hypothetical protein
VADPRRFETEDLLIRPGTYFNPQTEILVVVDDSPRLDPEIFETEELEGAEWILVSDETPLDEPARDELLERFEAARHAGAKRAHAGELDDEGDDEDEEDEEDELGGELDDEDLDRE